MPSSAPMPVRSEPAVDTFPVTDIDVIFSSGHKYACTLKDGVDTFTTTETHYLIRIVAPAESIEILRAHVAMLSQRARLHQRRVETPPLLGAAPAKAYGR